VKHRRPTAERIVIFAALLLVSLLVIYPFSVLAVTSLKTQPELFENPAGLPRHPTLRAYAEIVGNGRVYLAMSNSVLLTGASVLGQVVAGSLCAYALVKMKFRRARAFSLFFLAPMVYPIFSGIVPLYLLFTRLKLTNSALGLILVYCATGIPLTIFIYTSFMKTIPYQLSEAAFVEGATHASVYALIVLPLLMPAIVTSVILASLTVWNDFFLPFIMISSQRKATMPLWVFQYRTERGFDWPKTCAAVMALVTPIIVLYVFLQQKIIGGMVAGAVKG